MTEANSIIEAAKFMFMGLGVVFFVLIVVVYVFKLQNVVGNIFSHVNNEDEKQTPEYNEATPAAKSIDTAQSVDEKQLTAAIAAALQHHDNTNKQIAAAITAAILHHNNKGE
ncbi:MAG: OadG family protein [Arcobacter sp.]|nr:OadG family protein [Arcobacter sp.]